MSDVWTGGWVADRLSLELLTDAAVSPALDLRALVGVAVRRNPRRAHLLVSTVLGKHIPTDPRIVYGAGRLLGRLVAERLGPVADGQAARRPDVAEGGRLLAAALAGDEPAAATLVRWCERNPTASPAVVLGFAETATGLGHAVADALAAPYLHSTRRADGGPEAGTFEEEHSHATTHRLQPEDPGLFGRGEPLVLVDDELSTGRTVLNTIRTLHARYPGRERYVVASLVDLRTPADRDRLAELAAGLGVTVDVVSLVAGHLGPLSGDVMETAAALIAEHDRVPDAALAEPGVETPQGGAPVCRHRWPEGAKDGGRHGFTAADAEVLSVSSAACATALAAELVRAAPPPKRVLVLGFEELMYAPLRLALDLVDRLPAASTVRYSATTRSPVLPVDDPQYAIRTALRFAAHDRPADGAGDRFAYNVTASGDGLPFTDVVLVIDDPADTPELDGPAGVLDRLRVVAGRVHLVVVPSHRRPALPSPLTGPGFGSYPAADVRWLLTDLSALRLEAPVAEREREIQAGRAHYAESLPIEYQPSAEYQALFRQALEESARDVAGAVGVVTELALAARGRGVVLASLARAGTPIGVLMRCWAQEVHGLQLPHYAVSIVRGRGIDALALRYLAAHHRPADVLFVDGWTGKGAIAAELADAVRAANAELGLAAGAEFSPELAVLADPGCCVGIFGTRDDYLIPSACLNSTVSGLVSRTVLNDALIGPGQYHGAKFYAELGDSDVSAQFVDAIRARFAEVSSEVEREIARRARSGPPEISWAGLRTVRRLARQHGIDDLNLVKPGVGETTRVLLRRVPWKVLMRRDAADRLGHVRLLAEQRRVPVEFVDELAYSCVGLIRPVGGGRHD